MIFNAVKKAMLDLWEELLLLGVFNLIWCLGTLLILPWPFVTFGLFYTVRDVSQGKAIKFRDFFVYGRQKWKEAYIWGGVNVAVILVAWLNLRFYAAIEARWAGLLQVFIIALLVFWGVLQLVALPIYPRLETPGLKLALRNALVVVGRYPLAILVLVIFIVLSGIIASIFPVALLAIVIVLIASLTNRIVDEAVKREVDREA